MPSEDDIVQRIVLEGDKAVIAQFNVIGAAGENAFNRVNDAAKVTGATFAKSGQAFSEVIAGFRGTKAAATDAAVGMEAASKSGIGLAQTLRLIGRATGVRELSRLSGSARALGKAFEIALPAILIAGLGKLASAGAKAAGDFDDLAASLKVTNPQMQALQAIGNASGLSFDELSTSMKAVDKLTKDTAENTSKNSKEYARLNQELDGTAIKSGDLAISFRKVAREGRQSAADFAKSIRDIGQASIDSNRDFNISLRNIQERRNDIVNGAPDAQTQRTRQLRDLEEQEAQLRDKQTRDIQKNTDDQVAAVKTFLDAQEARRIELRKLNIEDEQNFRKQDEIRKAMSEARAEADRNATALEKLGISAIAADGKLKKAPETLLDIAGALGKLKDPTKQLAIEQDLINAGIDRKLIPALRRGTEGFKALQEASKNINPGFTPAQIENADKFSIAIGQVGDAISALFKQAGVAITPDFVGVFESIRDLLVEIRPGIVEFAKSLSAILTPALKFIADLIRNVVVPVFRFIIGIFDQVAKVINNTFKTNITGTDLFIGALLSLGAVLRGGIILIQAIVLAIGLIAKQLQKVDWSSFGKAATSAFTGVVDFAKKAVALVVSAWTSVKTFFVTLWTDLLAGSQFIWDSIVGFASDAVEQVKSVWTSIAQFFTDLWAQLTTATAGLWQTVVDGANVAIQLVKDGWNGLITFFSNVWTALKNLATSAWIWVSDQAQISIDFMSGLWDRFKQKVFDVWDAVKNKILEIWNSVKDKVAAIFGGGSSTTPSASPAPAGGMATGGQVRGPGSGTSDSILARLSNGEWVMKAAAVRKYGLGFMNAINSMRFNPGGFADGGMIGMGFAPSSPQLRFADGGLVPSRKNILNLSIGDQTFSGLGASDDTMNALTKFATGRQIRSAGRKPSWHGGR